MLKKMLRRLPLVLAIFLLSSCGSPQKTVSQYQDKVSQAEYTSQEQPEISKSLPVVKNVPPEKNDAGQARSGGTDKTTMPPGEILPALTLVNDRIIAYENKLQTWAEFSTDALQINLNEEQRVKIAACQHQLQDILADYNKLHEIFLNQSSGKMVEPSRPGKLVSVERNDISFLESDCQQIIKINQQPGGWLTGTKYRLIEEKEKEIVEAMAQRDYLLVIDLFGQITPENRQDVSIETIYDYGQALLRTNNVKKAETVFLGLLARIRQDSELKREFQLMRLVADIDFGLKEYTRSFERYIDVINRYAGLGDNVEWARRQQSVIGSRDRNGTEVSSFAELVLAYLTYNAERDGYGVVIMARNFMDSYPDSPQYPTVARILLESGDRAEAWFRGVVEHLNRLEVEKKYEEALTFIEQLPGSQLLPEKQDQLKVLSDELISARFEEAEIKRQALEKELQETWNLGQAHLMGKKYDQAIEVFTLLQDTVYGDRAMIQVQEAAQLAAQDNRNKAAELFVRASSTREVEKRIELLVASRELLLSILIKYPQSGLVEKVKKNLGRIEEEIGAVDPALLNSLTNENPSGTVKTDSDLPSAYESSPGRDNGQVDSSMYTGKDLQE